MNKKLSPASLISIAGGVLAVIGLISYFSNAANLSVPTFFYGVPILLIGLALKNSELDPAKSKITPSQLNNLKQKGPEEFHNLIGDVTRFRYGQRAHIESSLKVLKLWDEEKPPQLLEIELLEIEKDYGICMKFKSNGVPLKSWKSKEERLGRFFAKNLTAKIVSKNSELIELTLIPNKQVTEISSKDNI